MTPGRKNPVAEIRQLYFKATPATILRDFHRAIDLLKSIPDPAERERASGYMEGLAELRKEFRANRAGRSARRARQRD